MRNGLRMGVFPGGCWSQCGDRTQARINSKTLGVQIGPGGGVVVIGNLL